MVDIVNLRLVRKRAKRKQDAEQAAQQRVVHGLPKAEEMLTQARQDKTHRELEQHRIEPGDGK